MTARAGGRPAIPAGLMTPYLMVDIDVLRRNLSSMAARAAEQGLALRPHAKTHKSLEIAGLQLELGATGLSVATVSEAEIFAAGGCTDLFIAYPIWADGRRALRLRTLAGNATLRLAVDSVEAAQQLARALGGAPAQVLVEIDSGHHRSGVSADLAGEVAEAAQAAGLEVIGVFTFPGHSYGPGAQRSLAAADEANALDEAGAALRRSGIEPVVRSGGSTPSVAYTDPSALNEMRPGVYAFNDAQQLELGACDWPEIALSAAATVVSARPGRIILDSGSKVLGADRLAWASGFGRLPDFPDARIVALSEHHATVELAPGSDEPALGDHVRVVPNHVCSAVNLADEYVVVSEGAVISRWEIAARGRNT
jgi:D-serine deaminase-like pyridoxal phosphate-dependent protein